jgi:hypothetical protein
MEGGANLSAKPTTRKPSSSPSIFPIDAPHVSITPLVADMDVKTVDFTPFADQKPGT